MADATVKRLEEFEGIYGGAFRRVRAGLGVESFGLAVFDLPPDFDAYPEHDHSEDGQEEVYTALEGSATITINGEDHELAPGVFARVPAGVSRKVWTGEGPVRVLVVGGAPGRAYEPPAASVEGNPDPLTGQPPAGS
jgi:quercetin dioxygenase-like cupin family protein